MLDVALQCGWMVRVALAAIAVAVLPGTLTVLAWYPRASFSLLECLSLGLAVGLGLNELLTVAAIGFH